MLKRILIALLAMLIAVSLFSCKNDDSKENENLSGESDTASENTDGETEFVPVTADPYDYMENDLEDYIKLGEYRGLSVDKISSVLTDELFDDKIDELLEQYATYEKITDRPVAEGDTVICDYAGYHDGVQFSGGTATGTELTVSADSGYIEGFAEAFVGKVPGIKFTFNVTFPDPYTQNEDLSGEEVLFSCTVHYIKGEEPIVPELTDEFVYEKFNYSNVDEFLIAYRSSVEKQHKYEAESQMYTTLWNQIVDSSEVISYPGEEVERLYSQMRITYQDYATSYGIDYDTFIEMYIGMSDEDLMDICRTYVKEDLVMYQLVKELDIELTDERYDEELKFYADYYGATEDELISYYGEESIRLTILWQVIMESVFELSVVVE